MTIMAREQDPVGFLRPYFDEFKKRYKWMALFVVIVFIGGG